MSDPFSEKHKADEAAGNRQAAKDALAKHKAEVQQRVAEAQKTRTFNDLPVYRPRDPFKLGLL